MASRRTEVFYVRVELTGPPENVARATRYAKENVGRSTDSLSSLGVDTSVGVYSVDGTRERSTLYGSAEEPPLRLSVKEEEEA